MILTTLGSHLSGLPPSRHDGSQSRDGDPVDDVGGGYSQEQVDAWRRLFGRQSATSSDNRADGRGKKPRDNFGPYGL